MHRRSSRQRGKWDVFLTDLAFIHFWHAPLAVCSAKHRHQSPEWTILSHVSCFIQGEVIGFQVLLDSLHSPSMRASQWSPPAVIIRFLFHWSPSISRSSVKTLDVLFLFISRFQWHQIIGCRLTSIVCSTSIFYWLLLLKSFFPQKTGVQAGLLNAQDWDARGVTKVLLIYLFIIFSLNCRPLWDVDELGPHWSSKQTVIDTACIM